MVRCSDEFLSVTHLVDLVQIKRSMLHRTRGSLDSRDVWLTPHRWLLHLWTRKLALLARTLNSHWRVYIWRKNRFQSKKVHTHVNIVTQESIYPVILSLKKSPPRGFPGSRKSLRPVIFRCKKNLRPVIFFIKKSLRPVIFGAQKSTRPLHPDRPRYQ